MEIEIPGVVLKNTNRCKKNFSCLSCEKKDLCEVQEFVGGEVLFIRSKDDQFCDYMMPFGNRFICGCPTRKEIFRRYKI